MAYSRPSRATPYFAFSYLFLQLFVTILSFLPNASAVLKNVTVDDWYRDPTDNNSWVVYSPVLTWPLNEGGECDTCTAHPDPAHAYFATWHESINYATGASAGAMDIFAHFSFTGVAVYVYCIIPLSSSSPNGNAAMTFMIDNTVVGSYVHAPNGTEGYEYEVPVYVNTSLSEGTHSITIINGHAGQTQPSLLLLDYIIYTHNVSDSDSSPTGFQTSPPSSPTSNSTSISTSTSTPADDSSSGSSGLSHNTVSIIGLSVGLGVLGLANLGLLAFLLFKRWSGRRASSQSPSAQYIQSVSRVPGAAPATDLESPEVEGAQAGGTQAGWVQGAEPASTAGLS